MASSSKFSIAKFETAEFVIGNALLIFGGLLLTPNTFNEFTMLGAAMMIVGIILDIRVFNSSRHEREILTNKIVQTTHELDNARAEMQQHEASISNAEHQLQETINEMRQL